MGPKTVGATETNRRSFMLRGATGLGAMAMSSGLAEAAPEEAEKQTMSQNIIYPNHAGARFGMAYYRTRHIPRAMKVMSADRVILIEGVPMGDTVPPYVMICHFQFASAAALTAAVADPGMAEIRVDVAKFTDIQQTVMIGRS